MTEVKQTSMRRPLLAFLLLLPLHAARGEPLWRTLPPTPAPVPGEYTGHAKVNGISLYYATIGHGSPVVLLHGGRQLGQRGCEHQPSTGVARTQEGR
jgi:hypothetical protein